MLRASENCRASSASAAPLRILLEPIAVELEAVERRLAAELRSRHPFVDQLLRYGCLLGGKRLRPALLLLSGRLLGPLTPAHTLLATVIEMIHTATLVHDDVLDEARVRRHLDAVHARWDVPAAVLLGDLLFSHAFYLASSLESTDACRWIGQTTNRVCEGELRQKGQQGNWMLDERQYLEIVDRKTAELCACSCRLGAQLSGADEAAVERLASYGRNLGVAFQIADDVLDLAGTERQTGKSLGTDLQQRRATLPIIWLMQTSDARQRRQLVELLEAHPPQRATLDARLAAAGAIDYARQRAHQFAAQARHDLEPLADGPLRRLLVDLTRLAVDRAS